MRISSPSGDTRESSPSSRCSANLTNIGIVGGVVVAQEDVLSDARGVSEGRNIASSFPPFRPRHSAARDEDRRIQPHVMNDAIQHLCEFVSANFVDPTDRSHPRRAG